MVEEDDEDYDEDEEEYDNSDLIETTSLLKEILLTILIPPIPELGEQIIKEENSFLDCISSDGIKGSLFQRIIIILVGRGSFLGIMLGRGGIMS